MSLKSCIQDMRSVLIRRIDRSEHEIKQNLITLEENNPSNILSKGYTFMEGPDGKVVASASDMEEGGRYRIYFRDGTVEVTVSEIKEGGKIDF